MFIFSGMNISSCINSENVLPERGYPHAPCWLAVSPSETIALYLDERSASLQNYFAKEAEALGVPASKIARFLKRIFHL